MPGGRDRCSLSKVFAKFHGWTHASLTLLLDHLSVPGNYVKDLPDFQLLFAETIHIFNCEGFWIHTLRGLQYADPACRRRYRLLQREVWCTRCTCQARRMNSASAITAPISGCWLVPTNRAPPSVHKIGLTECCFQSPLPEAQVRDSGQLACETSQKTAEIKNSAHPNQMLVPRHTSDSE